jgi:hypothetical protein
MSNAPVDRRFDAEPEVVAQHQAVGSRVAEKMGGGRVGEHVPGLGVLRKGRAGGMHG